MLEGGLSQVRHEQILDFMAQTQTRFNVSLNQEFQAHFRGSPQLNKSLPNKYLHMDRGLRKTEPEIPEWVKPAAAISLTAAAILGGLILYRKFEAGKKDRTE
jgi:hypothetical protein